MSCEYLRRYIEEGHKNTNEPLDEASGKALEAFDRALNKDSGLVVHGYLKPGQILLSNNLTTIHGRTPFEDYTGNDGNPIKNIRRLARRTWIVSNNPV